MNSLNPFNASASPIGSSGATTSPPLHPSASGAQQLSSSPAHGSRSDSHSNSSASAAEGAGSARLSSSSVASSASVTSSGIRKDDKYAFAAFCEAEEREIAALRSRICALVEGAIDDELAAVGPLLGDSEEKGKKEKAFNQPIHLRDLSSASATHPSTSMLCRAETLAAGPLAAGISRIGAAIHRERARITTTAARQHRRWALASQGLLGAVGGGGFSSSSRKGIAGKSTTAKSAAKAALAAKKRLNESSDFVEGVAAAVSVAGLLGGRADSVGFATAGAAFAALRALDTTLTESVGLSFFSSGASAEKAEGNLVSANVLRAKHRVGGTLGLPPATLAILASMRESPSSSASTSTAVASQLLQKAITTQREQQSKAVSAAGPTRSPHWPPLPSVSRLTALLAEVVSTSANADMGGEEATKGFSPFSAFAFGKELFLQFQQNYSVAVSGPLEELAAAAERLQKSSTVTKNRSSPASKSESGVPVAVSEEEAVELAAAASIAEESLCALRDAALRLIAAITLLIFAANAVLPMVAEEGAAAATQLRPSHMDAADVNHSSPDGSAASPLLSDLLSSGQQPPALDRTTEGVNSIAAAAPSARPSFLTAFPKPMYAGDVWYLLGCALRAAGDFVTTVVGEGENQSAGGSNNDETAVSPRWSGSTTTILGALRSLLIIGRQQQQQTREQSSNKASLSSFARASSATEEWSAIVAVMTEWLPYQCPAAAVALGTRCLDRFEAQEERAGAEDSAANDGDEEIGSLTLPSFIETREDSDEVFIRLSPLLCAMQCLSLNEGNHGGAWQLLAESIGNGECVEIGDPTRKQTGPINNNNTGADVTSEDGAAVAAMGGLGNTAASSFLRGVGASLLTRSPAAMAPLTAAANPLLAAIAPAWEGGLYLGEHTKTSAYVEAIRCAGGILGTTPRLTQSSSAASPSSSPSAAAPSAIVNYSAAAAMRSLWLPLAQSLFYSTNPDVGAEEVLVACEEGTWFGDEGAEVCRLDRRQMLQHIIASDRYGCPSEAYVELGALAAMGFVFSERDCGHLKYNNKNDQGNNKADMFAASDEEEGGEEQRTAQSSSDATDTDANRKLARRAKAAYRSALDTATDALSALVAEVLSTADEEFIPSDGEPAPPIPSLEALRLYFGPAASLDADLESLLQQAVSVSSASSASPFALLLSQREEFEVAKAFVRQRLRLVREEASVISFEPIVKQKPKASDTEAGGATSAEGGGAAATLSGIEMPQRTTLAAAASDDDDDNVNENKKKQNDKKESQSSSSVSIPPPMTLRKMDCFALALSLAPRSAKAWVRLGLGMEDKPLCRLGERKSLLNAAAAVAERLLLLNAIKGVYTSNNSNAAEDGLKREEWTASVFPRLMAAMARRTAPSAEALTRATLLATAAAPAATSTFVEPVLQHDPLVYERSVFSLGASPSSSASDADHNDGLNVTRAEALMRAVACDCTDGRTWFILGTTLAERQQAADRHNSVPTSTASSLALGSVAARLALLEVSLASSDRLPTAVRIPARLVPPAARQRCAIEEGEGVDEALVAVTAADCFRAALAIANANSGAPASKSIRASVLQWCKKNSFSL